MSVFANAQCLICHLERNVQLAQKLGDEIKATAFAKELMKVYLASPADASAPYFGPETSRLFHEFYGLDIDRFKQEKAESNAFVLERLGQLRQTAESAADPVFAGLQLAILGNYIDFAALRDEVSFEKLDQMIETALEMKLDMDTYRAFCADLERGTNLLYLTDNAGEIGFDRIFAEQLHKKYPHLQITFCVRGGPANNDATRADAAEIGIPFPVIDNGNCIAGTQLDMLSPEAQQAFDTADVILSKGQGNVETLLGCGYNVYYAFLVKCPRFMERFGKEKLAPMLLKERA